MDQYKSNTIGHEFNHVTSNNLLRIITVPPIKQNKWILSYDYYGSNISKENSFLENRVLYIAKSINVDNRTNSKLNAKSFDVKLSIILDRKELCVTTE